MPVIALTPGPVHTITQNVAYAMPPRLCHVSFSAALEGAFDPAGPWVSQPGSPGAGGGYTSAPFIRCPTGNAQVRVVTG